MRHGGDLSEAITHFGGMPHDWLDLSTGINPQPWPVEAHLLATALHHLPTLAEEKALIDAARQAYLMPEEAAIAAVPGTQAAIQWLPRLASEGDAAIIGPTYSEHAFSWRRAGHRVTEICGIDALPSNARHAVIVNPNNPDGRIADRPSMLGLAKEIKRRDGWLIVDEAFADIDPAAGYAKYCMELPIIVLRSFGKFFGLPGLRLGCLIAAPPIAASFKAALGPWPVSTLALIAGAKALADHAWADAARIDLASMARRLDHVLESGGLKVIGGTSLFRFAYHADAKTVHERLAQKYIWCRRFDNDKDHLRFGLPRSDQDLLRLKEALQSI